MSLVSMLKGTGPSGFGYGSTAEDVTEGLDLGGRTILLTGCNSGIGNETLRVSGGQSVVVPAGHWHGFKNVLDTTLHVRATIAAPVFEAGYVDRNELTRRYLPPGIKPV